MKRSSTWQMISVPVLLLWVDHSFNIVYTCVWWCFFFSVYHRRSSPMRQKTWWGQILWGGWKATTQRSSASKQTRTAAHSFWSCRWRWSFHQVGLPLNRCRVTCALDRKGGVGLKKSLVVNQPDLIPNPWRVMHGTGKEVWDWRGPYLYPVWTHFRPLEGYVRDGKGDTGLMSLCPYPVCTHSESLEGYARDRKRGMVLKKSLFFYPVWSHSKPLVGYAKDRKGGMGLMGSVTVSSLHSLWITRGLPKGQERRSWIEGICTLIQSALILNHSWVMQGKGKGVLNWRSTHPFCNLFWIIERLYKGQERGSWVEGVCKLFQSAFILNHWKVMQGTGKGILGGRSLYHSMWITRGLCKGQERGYWVDEVCIIPCESLEGYARESKGGIGLKKSLSSVHSIWITRGLCKGKERGYWIQEVLIQSPFSLNH